MVWACFLQGPSPPPEMNTIVVEGLGPGLVANLTFHGIVTNSSLPLQPIAVIHPTLKIDIVFVLLLEGA